MRRAAPQAPTEATPDGAKASLGELLGEVSRDMSSLVRQEVQLAKAELRQEATNAGKAAGMFVGVGLAGFMLLLFLSYAMWWGLANVIDQGLAALVVAGVWALLGIVLFGLARSRLREIRGLPRTTETVRAAPTAFAGNRNSSEERR